MRRNIKVDHTKKYLLFSIIGVSFEKVNLWKNTLIKTLWMLTVTKWSVDRSKSLGFIEKTIVWISNQKFASLLVFLTSLVLVWNARYLNRSVSIKTDFLQVENSFLWFSWMKSSCSFWRKMTLNIRKIIYQVFFRTAWVLSTSPYFLILPKPCKKQNHSFRRKETFRLTEKSLSLSKKRFCGTRNQ